jgi:quercetin dioxygenase-like cupin family protein
MRILPRKSMKSLEITLALALLAAGAAAQTIHRHDLQHHDLSAAGYETIQTRVDFDPKAIAPKHPHPGEEIIYVLAGTIEYTIEGKPPVTLKAGDVFFVPAETYHSAKNVGTGVAQELATYVVQKGKPLVEAAKP